MYIYLVSATLDIRCSALSRSIFAGLYGGAAGTGRHSGFREADLQRGSEIALAMCDGLGVKSLPAVGRRL